MIDISHESLMRVWQRLNAWADEEREFEIGKQQLSQDLRDWEQGTETDKSGALWSGLKLGRARQWLATHPTQLTMKEHAFIQASVERAEAEERRRNTAARSRFANCAGAGGKVPGPILRRR